MNEKEMRDSDVETFDTMEELQGYINSLVTQHHDYGTCVYAMSMAATATFNYVASKLGVTGFQASCADMDVIRRTRRMNSGFMILNYENLLYPQYLDNEHFPGFADLIERKRVMLAKMAKEKLAEDSTFLSKSVRLHWEWLASRATQKEIEEEER